SVYQRADLDVDYEEAAATCIHGSLDAFYRVLHGLQGSAGGDAAVMPFGAPTAVASQYTKKTPFEPDFLAVQKNTGRDSTIDVRHLEIRLERSHITSTPGDSLGVY
ncbi:sulfite reductase [NADPH] flavoprotein alpha-component, partial [Pseudoalteromonas sp. S185]